MASSTEYLIGGILCLIISIALAIIHKRISAATVVAFVLFLYGVYAAMKNK